MSVIVPRCTQRTLLQLLASVLLFFLASITQATSEDVLPDQASAAKTDTDMNFRLEKVVSQPTVRTDSCSTADHTIFEDLNETFADNSLTYDGETKSVDC